MILIFKAILRHKKTVLWFTLAGFAVSALVSLIIPKRFISYGSFITEGVSSELGGGRTFLSALGEFGESYSELVRVRRNFIIDYILRSRRMGLLMAERFDLRKRYGIDQTSELLEELNRKTSIFIRDEGVIVLGVEDEDPVKARDMVAGYLDNLDSLLIELDSKSGEYKRIYLEREYTRRKQKIQAIDSTLKEFMLEHGIFSIEEQIRGAYELLAELNAEKSILEIERGLIETVAREGNPGLREINKRIELMEEKIGEIMSGGRRGGMSILPPLENVPEAAAEYLRLVSEKRLHEFTMAFIKLKLEDAKLVSRRDVSVISVIDPPYVPERRVWPKRKQIVLVSTLSVLFLCCVVIAARESARSGDPEGER